MEQLVPARVTAIRTIAFVLTSVVTALALLTPAPPGGPAFRHADKLVHAGLFALLAASTQWRFGLTRTSVLALLGYALATELAQALWLSTRSGSLTDVAADGLGLALVVVLTRGGGRRGEASG